MKKIVLLVFLLLLTACNNERVEPIEQTIAPVLPHTERIGDILVTHSYTANVGVSGSFEHVPKAFHIRLVNVGEQAQSLQFLQHAQVMKDEETPANEMMMIEQEYPNELAPNDTMTLYVAAYSPTFNYDDMNMLRLEDVYLPIAPVVTEINEVEVATSYILPIEAETTSSQPMPTYELETLTVFECPNVPMNMECRENGDLRTYRWQQQEQQIELYTENDVITYGRVTFADDVLQLAFEQGELQGAMWNGEVVTLTTWMYICALQLQDLYLLVEPQLMPYAADMSMEDIDAYIKEVVRPAYEHSEALINSGELQPQIIDGVTAYTLAHSQKELYEQNGWTYSAFYIDNQLSFILKISPTRELTRYYIYDNYIARIVYGDGEVVQQVGYVDDVLQAVMDGMY